jgi:outer membrane protein
MARGRSSSARCLSIGFSLLCAGLLLAQPAKAEPIKIGYVDIEKVINESVPGQKAIEQLRKDFERRAAELKRMEEELRRLRQELDTKGPVMSVERRRQLEEEYRRERRELRRAVRDNNEEFNIKRQQMLVDFLPRILKAVRAIGKEKNYTLILRKEDNILLYSTEQVDLTNEVIARLNAQSAGQ